MFRTPPFAGVVPYDTFALSAFQAGAAVPASVVRLTPSVVGVPFQVSVRCLLPVPVFFTVFELPFEDCVEASRAPSFSS